ncbi:hypothetical protein [Micromonospora aurantiaca (nom. illeg.)]|uniref:hypothetical protein n=2 Tax=Micromonospora aurantiaca (nom. illeg.) TaxID=47850 RepID=UPI003EB7E459
MTKAHVPPQAAGNSEQVTSALVRISERILQTGRHYAGGLWLRGLCAECNSLAGARYDDAYADFARRLRSYNRLPSHFHFPESQPTPPVSVAPGLVARSVMFGMFAISPNLRVIFPELAEDLRAQRRHISMPDGATLRFAIYEDPAARLTGPVHSLRVLKRREHYSTFAEIFFRPLAWVLTPSGRGDVPPGGVSILDRQRWATADDWLQYGPDVTSVDLRNLCRYVPFVQHPLAGSREDWIEMYSDEITPILEGRIPV